MYNNYDLIKVIQEKVNHIKESLHEQELHTAFGESHIYGKFQSSFQTYKIDSLRNKGIKVNEIDFFNACILELEVLETEVLKLEETGYTKFHATLRDIDNVKAAAKKLIEERAIDSKSQNINIQQTETNTTEIKLDLKDMFLEMQTSENKFLKGLPMGQVIKHFEVFIKRKNKNDNYYLTAEQLISFLKKGFLNDTSQPKQKIDCANGEKGFVILRFYDFFNLAVTQYNHPQKKEKFITLFTDCFDNWDRKTTEHFFKPNKTKDKW